MRIPNIPVFLIKRMGAKAEVVCRETIKPSSPTPHHLREFKLSFLDGMAPFCYVPIVLFYSASDVKTFGTDFTLISDKLKKSLSDTLPLYYPFSGRMKGKTLVECNDAGVPYSEAKVPFKLSDFLQNVQASQINEFLPFDPYCFEEEDAANMAIHVTEFSCGGIAIGLCITHLIADAATSFLFLNAWGAAARGETNNVVAPHMEAAKVFPPWGMGFDISECMVVGSNVVTKRFIFDPTHLAKLRAELAELNSTRVEAVMALTWKVAFEAARATSSGDQASKTTLGLSVNVRKRMVPPLPDNTFGNLWVPTVTPLVEVDEKLGVSLNDYVKLVREMIGKVDRDYVRMFQGEATGISELLETLKEGKAMMTRGIYPCYIYSSWMGFHLYETDYGWGKPIWVSTVGVPSKWCVYLLPTRSGDGIEAWVNLSEEDMLQFERNPELLQFASLAS